MRLHRFFIQEKIGNKEGITLSSPELIHQWKNVFRFQSGAQVVLFDNSGYEFVSEIVSLTKTGAEVRVIAKQENKFVPQKNLTLFVSLIKKDNTEMVLQKGTELGVTAFVPLISERSEKKDLNIERAQKIIIEACEQSGRVVAPTLHTIQTLEHAISQFHSLQKMALDPRGTPLDKIKLKSVVDLGIFIGPEGGWTDAELKLFHDNNIPVYTLDTPVLRAETAAIAIASVFLI